MIEGVRIRSFKCLKDIEIELKPLTILIGPNGSGKSSILYAIYWFYLKSLHNPSLTYLCIPLEKSELNIESYSDLALGRELEKDWMEVVLKFNIPKEEIKHLLDGINWDVFGIEKPDLRNFEYGFGIKFNPNKKELDYKIYINLDDLKFEIEQVYNKLKDLNELFLRSSMKIGGKYEIVLDGRFSYALLDSIYLHSRLKNVAENKEKDELRKIDKLLIKIFELIRNYFENRFFFVKSIRGSIPLESSAKTEEFVDSGENVLNVLAQIYASADLDVREKLGGLMSKWADEFGLHKLVAGLEKDKVKARYKDIGKLDLALSSYGQRQLMTFLAQLIASPKGSFIMIEEPEISLHPEAQMKLPILFGEVIKKHKKRIIITTHSSIIPLALSDAIIEGLLRVDDVAIYHIERDEKGYSKRTKIELTEEGYPEGGIPSFAKVEAELYRKMMERLE